MKEKDNLTPSDTFTVKDGQLLNARGSIMSPLNQKILATVKTMEVGKKFFVPLAAGRDNLSVILSGLTAVKGALKKEKLDIHIASRVVKDAAKKVLGVDFYRVH